MGFLKVVGGIFLGLLAVVIALRLLGVVFGLMAFLWGLLKLAIVLGIVAIVFYAVYKLVTGDNKSTA